MSINKQGWATPKILATLCFELSSRVEIHSRFEFKFLWRLFGLTDGCGCVGIVFIITPSCITIVIIAEV